MDRNKIPVAMLAAVAMCGSMSMASYAQRLMVGSPVPVTPAPVTVVPHVLNSHIKPAATDQMPQPTKKPFAATGRILHVQNARNVQKNSIQVRPPATPIMVPAAMSMGGFSSARIQLEQTPNLRGGSSAPSPSPAPVPVSNSN
jgi:hypothetical protein